MSNNNSATTIMDMIMPEKILLVIKVITPLLCKDSQLLITMGGLGLLMITIRITITTTTMEVAFMHIINRSNNSKHSVIMTKTMDSRAIRSMK